MPIDFNGGIQKLLTNVSAAVTGPTEVCNDGVKSFTVAIAGSGTAQVDLYGADDGHTFVWLATFAMDTVALPTDFLTISKDSLTSFYMVTSALTGSPILNAHVKGVE